MKTLLSITFGLMALFAAPLMAADVPDGLTPQVCVEHGPDSLPCDAALQAIDDDATMVYNGEALTLTKSVAGCTSIPIASSFAEQPNGDNCPPTALEKAVGDITFGLVVFAVGAEALGADVFPLNAGILSGL